MNLVDIIDYLDTHYDDSNVQPVFRMAYYQGFLYSKRLIYQMIGEKAKEGEVIHDSKV